MAEFKEMKILVSIRKRTLIVIPLICAFIVSCDIFGPDKPIFENDEFRIQVDSIYTAVSINDTVIIKFWGVIGSDSCYKFWHFQSGLQPHKLEITLWGHRDVSSGNNCNSGNVNLSGEQYRAFPVEKGDFEIVVNQPNSQPLKRIVRIY